MKTLAPVIAPPAACTASELKAADLSTSTFAYEAPGDVVSEKLAALAGTNPTSFKEYRQQIKTVVGHRLPPELSDDRVVIAFRDFLTSVSAKAQLDAQVADGTLKDTNLRDSEITEIKKYSEPPNLKHSEMKEFANKFFQFQLKRGSSDWFVEDPDSKVLSLNTKQNAPPSPKKLDGAFVAYFKAYYDGKFYDRFGTLITKPQLPNASNLASLSNFSVPDSEIIAAETVLLEFLIDTIDRTPVMGNTKCPNPITPITCDPGVGSTVVATAIVTTGDSQNAPPISVVPSISIVANPASILSGKPTTLTVTANNATDKVTIAGSDGMNKTLTMTGGTLTVTPASTAVYTVSATGKAGVVTASAAVAVGSSAIPPPMVSIVTNGATDGDVSLTVTASNATSVVLTGSDGSTYNLKTTGGAKTVHPTSMTTYTVTATFLPSITYYPGNPSNQPTTLASGMAQYAQIPAGTDADGKPTGACGITTQNAWVLQTLANGASDEASTVGGLVANTPGGISIGLGVLGKISIGDNATLSDLVKTAASEMALRSTLFVSYYTLRHVRFTPISISGTGAQADTNR